ncbi:MAG TPA: VOC family protein [Gaiella sp.]|jgi:catechol 2,3-dioxygenase|nr:VOC family protein [Gaiella sp.]
MAELPADTRLGAIRLRAGDVGLLRDFYERAIGLQALAAEDGVTALGAADDALVELLSDPDAPTRPPRTTGLFHLALLVPTRADLAHALRRVFEAGWHLSGASDHLVSEALYLSDPEGNGIELYRDRPREEWPHQGDEIAMATLPLDLEGLLAEPGGDTDIPPMAEGTVLGHVHLQVADLDTAASFWVDALGLDVRTRLYPGALFVSAGGYHHHVGLNTWAGVGAPRPPAGARGLDRFEIVLPDGESLAVTRDRLAAAAAVQDVDGGILAIDPSGNAVLARSDRA